MKATQAKSDKPDDKDLEDGYAHGFVRINGVLYRANSQEDYKDLINKFGNKAIELLNGSSKYLINKHL